MVWYPSQSWVDCSFENTSGIHRKKQKNSHCNASEVLHTDTQAVNTDIWTVTHKQAYRDVKTYHIDNYEHTWLHCLVVGLHSDTDSCNNYKQIYTYMQLNISHFYRRLMTISLRKSNKGHGDVVIFHQFWLHKGSHTHAGHVTNVIYNWRDELLQESNLW